MEENDKLKIELRRNDGELPRDIIYCEYVGENSNYIKVISDGREAYIPYTSILYIERLPDVKHDPDIVE